MEKDDGKPLIANLGCMEGFTIYNSAKGLDRGNRILIRKLWECLSLKLMSHLKNLLTRKKSHFSICITEDQRRALEGQSIFSAFRV